MAEWANHDWRRWLAALCVLLIAFLYLAPAHASEHAAPPHGAEVVLAAGDGLIVHTHEDAGHGDHDTLPEHDGSEPHAHHCVSPHTAFFSNDGGLSVVERAAVNVAFGRTIAAHASHLTFGLERPPRSRTPT